MTKGKSVTPTRAGCQHLCRGENRDIFEQHHCHQEEQQQHPMSVIVSNHLRTTEGEEFFLYDTLRPNFEDELTLGGSQDDGRLRYSSWCSGTPCDIDPLTSGYDNELDTYFSDSEEPEGDQEGSPPPDRRKYVKRFCRMSHDKKSPHLVAKRNARERKRVQAVNAAFIKLRKVLPFAQGRSKRVSKVRTLQEAIGYIAYLQHLLKLDDRESGPDSDPVMTAQDEGTTGDGPFVVQDEKKLRNNGNDRLTKNLMPKSSLVISVPINSDATTVHLNSADPGSVSDHFSANPDEILDTYDDNVLDCDGTDNISIAADDNSNQDDLVLQTSSVTDDESDINDLNHVIVSSISNFL